MNLLLITALNKPTNILKMINYQTLDKCKLKGLKVTSSKNYQFIKLSKKE